MTLLKILDRIQDSNLNFEVNGKFWDFEKLNGNVVGEREYETFNYLNTFLFKCCDHFKLHFNIMFLRSLSSIMNKKYYDFYVTI